MENHAKIVPKTQLNPNEVKMCKYHVHLLVHQDAAHDEGEAQHNCHTRNVLGLLAQRPPSRRSRLYIPLHSTAQHRRKFIKEPMNSSHITCWVCGVLRHSQILATMKKPTSIFSRASSRAMDTVVVFNGFCIHWRCKISVICGRIVRTLRATIKLQKILNSVREELVNVNWRGINPRHGHRIRKQRWKRRLTESTGRMDEEAHCLNDPQRPIAASSFIVSNKFPAPPPATRALQSHALLHPPLQLLHAPLLCSSSNPGPLSAQMNAREGDQLRSLTDTPKSRVWALRTKSAGETRVPRSWQEQRTTRPEKQAVRFSYPGNSAPEWQSSHGSLCQFSHPPPPKILSIFRLFVLYRASKHVEKQRRNRDRNRAPPALIRSRAPAPRSRAMEDDSRNRVDVAKFDTPRGSKKVGRASSQRKRSSAQKQQKGENWLKRRNWTSSKSED